LWNDNLSSIYYSTDAAQSFGSATINGSTNLDATDIYTFFNDSMGYTFMRDGGNGDIYFYKTMNRGLIWDLVIKTSFQQTPTNIHWFNENEAFALVYTDILKTTNGGLSWSISHSGCSGNNELIYFHNGKGLAMCTWPVYTTDNGNTWTTFKNQDGTDHWLSRGSTVYGLQVFTRDNIVYFTSDDNKSLLTYDMNNIN